MQSEETILLVEYINLTHQFQTHITFKNHIKEKELNRALTIGTDQHLLYDIADGKGKLLQRDLFAPYEDIAKKPTALSPFP